MFETFCNPLRNTGSIDPTRLLPKCSSPTPCRTHLFPCSEMMDCERNGNERFRLQRIDLVNLLNQDLRAGLGATRRRRRTVRDADSTARFGAAGRGRGLILAHHRVDDNVVVLLFRIIEVRVRSAVGHDHEGRVSTADRSELLRCVGVPPACAAARRAFTHHSRLRLRGRGELNGLHRGCRVHQHLHRCLVNRRLFLIRGLQ